MPAKLIPDNEVEQLIRQGKTDREIVEYLENNQGLVVTEGALRVWRYRRGLEPRRARYNDLIPWRVKLNHTHLYVPKLLRFEARRRQGLELNPRDAARLEKFKQNLAEAFDGRGGVVHYDPETDQGWWIVERRPGVDTDIIRNPDVP